jgi:hypothetical protein
MEMQFKQTKMMKPYLMSRSRLVATIAALLAIFGVWLLRSASTNEDNQALRDEAHRPVGSGGSAREAFGTGRRGTERSASGNDDVRIAMGKFITEYKQVANGPEFYEKEDKLDALARDLVRRIGLTSALGMLDKVSGPGNVRNVLVTSFFHHAPEEPQEAARLAATLDDSAIKGSAWEGIAKKVGRGRMIDLELAKIFVPPPAEHPEILGYIMGNMYRSRGIFGTSGAPQNAAMLLKEAFGDSEGYHENAKRFLSLASGIDSFQAWNDLSSFVLSDDVIARDSLPRFFSAMAELDRSKALSTLLELSRTSPDSLTPALFDSVFSRSFEADASQAEQWLAEHEYSLPLAVRMRARGRLIAHHVAAGNDAVLKEYLGSISEPAERDQAAATAARSFPKDKFDSARKWMEQIADPEIRRSVEGHVWEAERSVLRQKVSKSPEESIQDIILGRSDHGDYWLEEAMATWVSKDFDQAVAWHGKNWNSLPAAKAQYVAAAFAKHALQQQDVETARQWAALIQDPKTKARIDEMVAKGAAGQ